MSNFKQQQRVEREEENRSVGFFAAMRTAHEQQQQQQQQTHQAPHAPQDDPDVVVIDDVAAEVPPSAHAPPRVGVDDAVAARRMVRAKSPRMLVCALLVLVPMTLALFVSAIASAPSREVAYCWMGDNSRSAQYHHVNAFTVMVGILGALALAVVSFYVLALARQPEHTRAARVVRRVLPVVLVALLISQIALAADFGTLDGLVSASVCDAHHSPPGAWNWLEAAHVLCFFASLFLLRRSRVYLAAHDVVLPRWGTCPARSGRGGESWAATAQRWTRGALVTADQFVGTARSWMSVTLRVKESASPYWSEMQLSGDRTLVNLGVTLAATLRVDARDIEMVLKNGDTRVLTDADVARLRASDTLVVSCTNTSQQ